MRNLEVVQKLLEYGAKDELVWTDNTEQREIREEETQNAVDKYGLVYPNSDPLKRYRFWKEGMVVPPECLQDFIDEWPNFRIRGRELWVSEIIVDWETFSKWQETHEDEYPDKE